MNSATKPTALNFAELLSRALLEPGIISTAYTAFHGYSIGNQILALVQCAERGIMPGPIATFMGWKDKGRCVRKGEKAIVLCMPITAKRKGKDDRPVTDASDDSKPEAFTRFVFRPNWFVLAQTDGQDVEPLTIPDWDQARALETLGISWMLPPLMMPRPPMSKFSSMMIAEAPVSRAAHAHASPETPAPTTTTSADRSHLMLAASASFGCSPAAATATPAVPVATVVLRKLLRLTGFGPFRLLLMALSLIVMTG